MGVQQLLPKLLESHSAGRDFDLRKYSEIHENNQTRKLRVAVDVSSWIYKACQGFGDMLADDRYLDNYGRALLLQELQQNDRDRQRQEPPDGDTNDKDYANDDNNIRLKIPKEKLHSFTLACTNFVLERLKRLATACSILVVLDGISPPGKKKTVQERRDKRRDAEKQRDKPITEQSDVDKRIKAFRRAGAGGHYFHVVDSLIVALRSEEIAFLVSPYESDGQLAFLSEQNLVDLVITEDSDLIACGANPILYKVLDPSNKKRKNNGTTDPNSEDEESAWFQGKLIRQADLNATTSLNLLDFSPVMLSVMFVAAGCDYCQSLKGIGIKKSNTIVRDAFYQRKKQDKTPPLQYVLEQLYKQSQEKSFTPEFKQDFEESFLAALVMYRHPVVYHPLLGKCLIRNQEQPDPELMSYPPYANLWNGTSQIEAIVGKIPPSPLACYVAEGWIHLKTQNPRTGAHPDNPLVLPKYIQSFLGLEVDQSEPESDKEGLAEQQTNSQETLESEVETQRLETQQLRSPEGASSPVDPQQSPNSRQLLETQPQMGLNTQEEDNGSFNPSLPSPAKRARHEPHEKELQKNTQDREKGVLESQPSTFCC